MITLDRRYKDKTIQYIFLMVAIAAVIIIFSILLFLFGKSLPAFQEIGFGIFSSNWNPRANHFGLGAAIWGSILVTIGAVVIGVPLGIGSALFLSEIVPSWVRKVLKPVIELLASVPSVIYGFIGIMILVPYLRDVFNMKLGESLVAGGVILGVMCVPIVVTMSDDALKAVPREMKEASLALGATKWQTIKNVIFPTAVSGIFASAILAIGKAIGETMAVLMVVGGVVDLPVPTFDLFESSTTLTALIANEMAEVGFAGLHASVLFAGGVILFIIVAVLSIISDLLQRRIEKKFTGEI
jgi:phosphate ABC transporter permease protein PstC